MKLTVSCQICGKVLSTVSKDQISDDDVVMYEAGSSCDTVSSVSTDDDGNQIIIYDGQTSIQATKTVS